ncbi:MAG: MmcQ/YjbR family DNA-binding protein [Actinomycetota bacterium]
MATWATVKSIGKKIPEVEEGQWYGTPSLKVRNKSFVRLKERGVIVVCVDLDEKEALLQAEPDVFFTTPHYDGYPAFLIRLANIDRDELEEMLIESWRRVAPKRLLKAFDADDV